MYFLGLHASAAWSGVTVLINHRGYRYKRGYKAVGLKRADGFVDSHTKIKFKKK